MAEKSTFLIKSGNVRFNKNVRHSVKSNILILLVLTDSIINTSCYMTSCYVTFENFEVFYIFKGPEGGIPKKVSNCYLTKNKESHIIYITEEKKIDIKERIIIVLNVPSQGV